jgi:MFS family permease
MGEPPDRPTRFALRAWLNVAVAAALMVATLPGRSIGLGLLTGPILRDFPLSDVQFGAINLWASILGAAFCLPAGWLIDRLGVRIMTATVLVALGGAVYGLTAVGSVWALAVVILLTRGFGQSALSVVSLGVVGKTPFGRREVAMGVFAVIVGVGMAAAISTIQAAEQGGATDWRAIWSVMGIALVVAALPCALLVWQSGDVALRPIDGEPAAAVAFPLREALRTPAFWSVALTCSFFNFVSSGTMLFYEKILESFGFNRGEYETMLTVSFLSGAAFNLFCGWLGRYWSLTRLLGFGSVVLAGSLAALPLARTPVQLYAYGAAAAFAGGAVTVVFFTIWRPLFGAPHLGKILAAAQLLTIVASALGQWLFPAAAEAAGSYVPLLNSLAVVAAGLGVWTMFVPAPRKVVAARYTDPSPV